jgi:hypothetical protein
MARTWWLLSAVLLAGCSGRAEADKEPSARLRGRLGDQTIAILKGATKVEVFRVDGRDFADPAKEKEGQDRRIGGYAATATGPEQGGQFASRASALLLDAGNFELDLAKGCKFDPGVALRFWKEKESAEIVFCFRCDELKVVAPDPSEQGVKNPYADFGPGRAAFVKLAKEAFPDDKEIQGLKE